MQKPSHGVLTQTYIANTIDKHIEAKNLRALKRMQKIVDAHAEEAELIEWPLLAESWRRDAGKVQAAIQQITKR